MIITRDEKHQYKLDGAPVVGVTEVLKSVGAYGPDAGRYWTEQDRQRGTDVHKLIRAYNLGLLDMTWCGDLRGYVEGWASFLRDYKVVIRPDSIERMVGHKDLRFAGQLDCATSEMSDPGYPTACPECILDLKTGRPHPVHAIQTAAYRQAWQHMQLGASFSVPGRGCVYLAADGTYEFCRHIGYTDGDVWSSLFNARNWFFNNGLLERREDEH